MKSKAKGLLRVIASAIAYTPGKNNRRLQYINVFKGIMM